MAGTRGAWDAFFRQSGVTRVESLSEWVDAMLALYRLPASSGNTIFIGTGGGGSSVIAGDLAAAAGLEVPDLAETTSSALRDLYPDVGSIVGNPLDGFVTVHADLLSATLDLIDRDPSCAMVLVEHMIMRAIYHVKEEALPDPIPAIVDHLTAALPRKPTVFSIDSDGGTPELAQKGFEIRRRFCDAGIPAYPSVRRAVRALRHLSRYHAFRRAAGW
jgi:acyl-CoA synthetase (NDP forming)